MAKTDPESTDPQVAADKSVAARQEAGDEPTKAMRDREKAVLAAQEDAQPKLAPNEEEGVAANADDPDSNVFPPQQEGGPTARAQAHHDPPGGFRDVERTTHDDVPVVAEGQVWEDLAPGHTEAGRRLRVLLVEDPEDGGSKVRVRNLQTEQESEIRLDRFHVDEGAFRRVV